MDSWETYKVSIPLPLDTPKARLAIHYLARDMRESRELFFKRMVCDLDDAPVYHHGDRV